MIRFNDSELLITPNMTVGKLQELNRIAGCSEAST